MTVAVACRQFRGGWVLWPMNRNKAGRRRGGVGGAQRCARANDNDTSSHCLKTPDTNEPVVSSYAVHTPDREPLVGAHHSQRRGVNLRHRVRMQILRSSRGQHGPEGGTLCCHTKQRPAASLRNPAECHQIQGVCNTLSSSSQCQRRDVGGDRGDIISPRLL